MTRAFENWWLALVTCMMLMMGYQPALAEEMAESKVPSLYDRLGGLMPISVVVSDFLDVLVPDEVLNANPAIDAARERVPTPYLKYQVTALVCHATGGPCPYQGRTMKESHSHLNITEAEWDQMVLLFMSVLAKHNVPEQEAGELLAIVDSTKADIVAPTSN
ncbi:MAG: group 1 truncated hemoglobin [Porticoccaceae bacterium]